MSNDEKKFHPIFQILHIKSACFLLELAMALVTTIGMRFLQVCLRIQKSKIAILVLNQSPNSTVPWGRKTILSGDPLYLKLRVY